MPWSGLRRVTLALATVLLSTVAVSGMAGVSPARAASDLTLNVLPDDGENAIYNFVNSATSSVNVTIYELNDVTLENDLVAREKAGVDVRVVVEDPSDYTSELNEITAAGGKVTGYSSSTGFYIHAKTVIGDYGTSTADAFVGSENFSSNSLNDNRDLGLITSDSGVLTGLETAFNADFTGSSAGQVAIFSPAPRPPRPAPRFTCRYRERTPAPAPCPTPRPAFRPACRSAPRPA